MRDIYLALLAFVLSTLTIAALRPLAVAVDLVDNPGGRKTHKGRIPIVGGIGMYLGIATCMSLFEPQTSSVSIFLGALGILVILGLVDDRFEISPWFRLPVQILAVVLFVLPTNLFVQTLGAPFSEKIIALSGFASYATTVILMVGGINAFNMLDGIDGLAGAIAIVAMAFLAYLAFGTGMLELAGAALIIIGAIMAFLIFNVPFRFNRPWLCFMGDSGSTLLGFSVAWMSLSVSQHATGAVRPIIVLWIVALPIYEVVASTVRRIVRGVSPFRPDTFHFHHQMLRAGIGVRAIFFVAIGLSILFGLIGVSLHYLGVSDQQSFTLFLIMGFLVAWLMCHAEILTRLIPKSLRRDFEERTEGA
ncbi:MAG: hypothetical protein R3E77_06025 [Steroidobacteraceae bacterium]